MALMEAFHVLPVQNQNACKYSIPERLVTSRLFFTAHFVTLYISVITHRILHLVRFF
jgi:hypothetical protein